MASPGIVRANERYVGRSSPVQLSSDERRCLVKFLFPVGADLVEFTDGSLCG
jgi:hypothetical protein